MMKKTIIILSVLVLLTSCLKEEHPFLPIVGITPMGLNDGWSVSTPSNENVDEQALINLYNDISNKGEPWQLRSLLVFRNNKLVAENYFKDPSDITTPKPIWSCTKQIMGVLTGVAIEEGVFSSIDDPISLYLSSELEQHQDKKDITISNLLTMKAGIDFDEAKDASALLQQLPDNTIDFILSKPLLFSPGARFSYNSGETHLLSASIQNAVNRPLEQWADEKLFSKIGFQNYTWLEYEGYNFGGFGISTTPRELAKIAHLSLNEGTYNGEQIVSKPWMEQMVTTQTETNTGSDYTFGNLWWINEAEGIYFMAGSGGQYACVVPDKNLVVVATSEHDTDKDMEVDFDTFLEIVKRIRETAK